MFRDRQVAREAVAAVLHTLEGLSEREVFGAYGVAGEDLEAVLEETGTPAGWHPLIAGYDKLPNLPHGITVPTELLTDALGRHARVELAPQDLEKLKGRLRALYEAGPGAREKAGDAGDRGKGDQDEEDADEDEGPDLVGARIEIPAETFVEELAQKLEVHPISIYWLLEEIRNEGAGCLPEERVRMRDRLTVMVLRLFGHQWPKEAEAGMPTPEDADEDGIIPLVEGTGEKTLLDRLRERLTEALKEQGEHQFELYFQDLMGLPLGDWLTREFFREHTRHFRRRPIVWLLESGRAGAGKASRRGTRKAGTPVRATENGFACMMYYHALNRDLLAKVRMRYLRPILQRREFELGQARKRAASGDVAARAEAERLEGTLESLRAFEGALQEVERKGFWSPALEAASKAEALDKYTARQEMRGPPANKEEFLRQEQAYDPDLNDGVRVNIAPLQRAGLLAADVLAAKDVEKAIADRARWRADERRWCREGKLPGPGWWGPAK